MHCAEDLGPQDAGQGGHPRPKPGPYRGPDTVPASSNGHRREPTGPNGSGPEQPTDGVRVSMPDEDERG
ncbi:MAG: hypothetical protein ACR2NH_00540 [Solirubrobacteraceae bacterium]